ncbi:MAG: hypothetical protein WA921_08125 [Ahrensia sp.]
MKPVVLDANLLLLLIVGTAGADLISKSKRLEKYNEDFFYNLIQLLEPRGQVIVTPHTLAEFWNMIGEKKRDFDTDHDRVFSESVRFLAEFVEVHVPAVQLTHFQELQRLGLSDVAQISAAEEKGAVLISDDGALCHNARLRGVEAISFWQEIDANF